MVTRDVAEEYKLKVGDPIVLSDLRVGIPVQGTVPGVACDTPHHYGDKAYYSDETARSLVNGQRGEEVNPFSELTNREMDVWQEGIVRRDQAQAWFPLFYTIV